MEKYIGKAFEELDSQEMINVQGGASPATTTLTSATTTSSVPCGIASAGVTAISVLSATVVSYVSKKFW